MIPVENEIYKGAVIAMDNKLFINCKFADCTLVYTGGDFSWRDTTFQDCKINFEGSAHRTIGFLRQFGLIPKDFAKPKAPPLKASGSELVH